MLVLLLSSCSGADGATQQEMPDAGADVVDSAVVIDAAPDEQTGDAEPAPICWDGCQVSRPSLTGGCTGLGQGDCNESGAGWFVSVPECGASQLYLEKCVWNPSGGCVNGPFYLSTQICEL